MTASSDPLPGNTCVCVLVGFDSFKNSKGLPFLPFKSFVNCYECFEYPDSFLGLIFLGFYAKYAGKSAKAPLL